MKSKALLVALIGLLDDFEQTVGSDEDLTLNEFTAYLNATQQRSELSLRQLTGAQEQGMQAQEATVEVEIARLISLMYRYAKTYIKKALRNSPFQGVDEFTLIIILMTFESLSKTELFQKNIMEKTSGTGVINRLIAKGLAHQFGDENDKRSQRLAVTEKGRSEIFRVLPEMNKVSEIISGNLSEAEKRTLAYLLKKLDYHHHELYNNRRDASLDELLSPRQDG